MSGAATKFTKTEVECMVLATAWDMIDAMVNYAIFNKNHNTVEAELRFTSYEAKELFCIRLADFLSLAQDKKLGFPPGPKHSIAPSDNTFLWYLDYVCEEPELSTSIDGLRNSICEFRAWLDREIVIDGVWLPSASIEADIKIERMQFLKIYGDFAKHGLPRLGRNAHRIKTVLANSNVNTKDHDGFLVMDGFCNWLGDNQIPYHATTIAEHLNNIRWGISDCLANQFKRSHQQLGDILYQYRYPDNCRHELPKSIYWELMNKVRSKPFVPRFQASEILKRAY